MALNFLLKRSATASKRPDPASMALGEVDLNYDAGTGGLFYKNSSGGVVKVGPAQVGTTAPNASPAGSTGNSTGEFWYDTSNSVLKIYNGSSWVNTVSTSGFLPLAGGTMTGNITFNGAQTFPVAGIQSASTTQVGVVQLNDTVSSTSVTEALTANQGKQLQDQINALAVSSNITLAGTIDASTGNLVTVTTEGTAKGFTIGSPLPSPVAGNDNYFVIVTVGGTMTPPGGSAQLCHQGDWWLSDGTAWAFLDVGFNATYATTATPGVVQLATDAEVQAGSNLDHAVTPSGLQSKVSDSTSTTSSTTIASSTAVKAAYDLANGAVPNTSFLALGDLLSGTGSGTYGNLPLGTDGDVLTADSTCSGGIKWAAGGGGGGSAATPTALGTVYGCMNTLDTTAVGYNALPALAGGIYNTALGVSAGLNLTLGECNVALGHEAMCAAIEGYDNVAVGFRALQNALCSSNTAVGQRAGRCITTGYGNAGVGRAALEYADAGSCNAAVGAYALRNSSGCFNSALGYDAGYCTTGGCNVFVGAISGCEVTTGSSNTFLGYNTGICILTGSYNVLIGSDADPGSDASCCLVIAGNAFNWLTGDSTAAIKPGAGIIDCANTCGSAGQVLQSTGANSVVWATPAAGYAGYNGYTATTNGTKFNVTGYPGELGQNLAGQLNIYTTYDNGSTGGLAIVPGSNALIFLNGYNGVGTSTVQAFNTSTGTFAVESVLYPAYTDITVTFTPTVTSARMNFYIRYLDATGNGGPGNGNIFSSFLTIF